jgi:hypothetical protein
MTNPRGNTEFAVYENSGTAYVMAYICTCGRVSVAFGAESHGHFNGTCPEGHDSTVLAS